MDQLEKKQLVLELMESPKTILSLVTEIGSNKKLVKFFDWMCNQKDHIYPHLLQGDNDFGEFQGQPVVWDGDFYLNNKGKLMYEGWAGASGMGGEVERVVKPADQVMAG